ncbi:Cys-tRNA(Pro) deacylase [Chitinophaga sp. Cy-1792]|uniref:Cys-tRNA(Pro) deacylase n=1 Tax=Chitinophaga sp. Cy-1792 TaxID=2608339 RepID=UPI00141DB2E6|nr:Cys-tRNA(Pro) deacylase [Chitinophaga sp. Cy-1792]NIG56583.1 Cys-tRNA(Pro) deacylase [Chitinophaga sp. Cy-1792]
MQVNKTNAARILDTLHIAYELITYEVDEEDLSATHMAAVAGLPIDQVFKTILLQGDKTGYLVCVVAGNMEIDLKKAAAASGNKRVEPVPVSQLLSLTGYIRGGCSPIGMKKPYPVFIDEYAELYDEIYVSAGKRGMQFKIAPADLVRAVDATVAGVSAE